MRPRVVLVKNQSVLRTIIESWLSPVCDLVIFSDSEGALDYIRSLSGISLIIAGLDLAESVVGGCSIARESRRIFPDVPVLILEWGSEIDHRTLLLNEMPNLMRINSVFGLWLSRKEIMALAVGASTRMAEQSP